MMSKRSRLDCSSTATPSTATSASKHSFILDRCFWIFLSSSRRLLMRLLISSGDRLVYGAWLSGSVLLDDRFMSRLCLTLKQPLYEVHFWHLPLLLDTVTSHSQSACLISPLSASTFATCLVPSTFSQCTLKINTHYYNEHTRDIHKFTTMHLHQLSKITHCITLTHFHGVRQTLEQVDNGSKASQL